MKFLLHALIALALGFAAFASVLPTPEDNPIVQIFEGESTNVTISTIALIDSHLLSPRG